MGTVFTVVSPCTSVLCSGSRSVQSTFVRVEGLLPGKLEVRGWLEELREQSDSCDVGAFIPALTSESVDWLSEIEMGMISTVEVASATFGFFVLGSSLLDQ